MIEDKIPRKLYLYAPSPRGCVESKYWHPCNLRIEFDNDLVEAQFISWSGGSNESILDATGNTINQAIENLMARIEPHEYDNANFRDKMKPKDGGHIDQK